MKIPVKVPADAMRPGRTWPGVGTGAVVIHRGCLLMVQRAGAHGAGTWSVPGGWVEFGEDPFDGAAREVEEETGIIVEVLGGEGWTSAMHPGEETVHAVTLWVRCAYGDAAAVDIEPGSLVYIDPPYRGTTAYGYTLDAVALFHRVGRVAECYLSEGRQVGADGVQLHSGRTKGGVSGSRKVANQEWLSWCRP